MSLQPLETRPSGNVLQDFLGKYENKLREEAVDGRSGVIVNLWASAIWLAGDVTMPMILRNLCVNLANSVPSFFSTYTKGADGKPLIFPKVPEYSDTVGGDSGIPM